MAQSTEEANEQAREVGRRQSLFREVNERIEGLADGFEPADEMEILCECAHGGCTELIALTSDLYEALRRVPTHFAVRAGHEIPAVERVVERHDGWVVVEKFGESGIEAAGLDPRRRAQ